MFGTGPLALYMLLQPKDIPRFHKNSLFHLNKQAKIIFDTLLEKVCEYLKCIKNFADG